MPRPARNKPRSRRERLAAQDWIDAALAAIAEGGLAAVSVEPLAARLGATKGSFYWHFANRAALVEAALRHWEESGTEQVIDTVDPEPDPEQRLRDLFKAVPAAGGGDPVEVALLATAGDPQVAPVLRRITERRVDYVTEIFADIGFPRDEARRRGLLVYTAHLGQTQLVHAVPHVLPATGNDRRRYLDTLIFTALRRE